MVGHVVDSTQPANKLGQFLSIGIGPGLEFN